MPELPEVETIRQELAAKLHGVRIRTVEVRLPKITSPRGSAFSAALCGVVILGVRRRGKLLLFDLKRRVPRRLIYYSRQNQTVQFHRIGQFVMIIHLKMTGQLVLRHSQQIIFGGHTISGARELPNKYTHVIFYFTNGDALYFNDLRQFGYLKLVSGAEAQKILDKYGLEPLGADFTFKRFAEILKKRRNGRLKSVLMDQSLFAGIGNIYAGEACWRAKVRPDRRVSSLSREELWSLWRAIKVVLKLAIKYRGTTFNTYVDSQGQAGNFVKYLKVYGRGGELCKVCGTILKKKVLGGRGTVYCPYCQR